MNKNIVIILAGGFLVAILVAVIVQAGLSGSKKKEVNVELAQILVAAKSMPVGHEVRAGDLKWQDWPKANLFSGAVIRDADQQPTEAVKGKLIRSMAEGEPVHMSLIVEDGTGDFLSANVQKGMRAVGISVKSHVLADRLIRPGDYVDVMVTYRVRINSRTNPEAQSIVNRYASETVIENVKILAIDNNDTKAVDEEEDGGKKKKAKASKKATVTLEVDPEGAEKLVLANKMGDLALALRSIGDNSDPGTDRATTDVHMSRVMTDLSNMQGTTTGVRIYSGDQINEVQARAVVPASGVDFDVEDSPSQSDTQIIFAPPSFQGVEDE